MSTRCNIIIKDKYNELTFYRHSDGYPEGVSYTLNKFLDLVKAGKIRNNVEQASGWLILIGASEYDYCRKLEAKNWGKPLKSVLDKIVANPPDWKVGAYEPSTGIHGDIEYLYEIDLEALTLKGWEHDGANKTRAVKMPKPKNLREAA